MANERRPDPPVDRGRDVIVTSRRPNYTGMVVAAVVVIGAIVLAVWTFGNEPAGTTGTTAPVETTEPTETTTDTTVTTTAP